MNYADLAANSPSAMRRATARELPTLAHAQRHISVPPTMNADASSGYSRMAFRSAIFSMSMCEAGAVVLTRLVGNASRANTAARTDAAQRAQLCYWPCPPLATHVDLPPTYPLGDFSLAKSHGLALCEVRHPWEPRRLAAYHYAHSYGQLSETSNWASHPLFLSAPEPLVRATPYRNPPRVRDSSIIPIPKPALSATTEVLRTALPP